MLSYNEVNLTTPIFYSEERNNMNGFIKNACRTVALWISAPYVLGLENRVITQRREIVALETRLSATRTMLEYVRQHDEEIRKRLKQVTEELDQVRELAGSDSLTGLKNRRGGTELFATITAAHLRIQPEVSVSIAAFDLDGFKAVNDERGHDAGDVVLQRVSAILSEVFKRSTDVIVRDVIVRTGGDEFVVIMLDTTLDQARQLAKVAVETIAKADSYGVTASAGIATTAMHRRQDTGKVLQALSERADAALGIAKRSGKNRVICAPGTSGSAA